MTLGTAIVVVAILYLMVVSPGFRKAATIVAVLGVLFFLWAINSHW